MKLICIIIALVLFSCNNSAVNGNKTGSDSTVNRNSIRNDTNKKRSDTSAVIKKYSNARFRDVTVENTGEHQFLITGKGQIFEASFGWVVEDGHEELKKGFQMTDAGAPEWGNFKFTVDVLKKRPNSTLTLILFETSAQDGSRQYELPIEFY